MRSLTLLLALATGSQAHVAAFVKGMYCLNGPDGNNPNANDMVNPLFDLPYDQWWMQAKSGCLNNPPAAGDSVELPANGQFTVELAHNQGQTTLSFGGSGTSEWPDGQQHPENWAGPGNPPDCIQNDGAMHTYNQSTASGTAWAISYESDISKVTLENLVVFSVAYNTPWKRVQTYEVPDLPACPEDGCYCAWLWVAPQCGEPNEYMANYKCHVSGATATHSVAPAQAPVYCDGNQGACVKGAKQMAVWNQAEGNNFNVPGGAIPGYNQRMGFANGRQTDIFQ